ncbi:MAG TPA: ATP-binding protein, partial [Spirochaetales bacterium]|nr:ATP-binding protein [Spirochaetales bacterium]
NALFAALEYWNGGFVFNQKRNCVAMLKRFPKKRRGLAASGGE